MSAAQCVDVCNIYCRARTGPASNSSLRAHRPPPRGCRRPSKLAAPWRLPTSAGAPPRPPPPAPTTTTKIMMLQSDEDDQSTLVKANCVGPMPGKQQRGHYPDLPISACLALEAHYGPTSAFGAVEGILGVRSANKQKQMRC